MTTTWKEIEILFKVLIEKTRDGPPADIPDDRCFLAVMGEGEGTVHLTGGGNMELMAKAMASVLYHNPNFIPPFNWALKAAYGRLEEEGRVEDLGGSECRICHRTGVEIDPDVNMCRSCWLDVRKGGDDF